MPLSPPTTPPARASLAAECASSSPPLSLHSFCSPCLPQIYLLEIHLSSLHHPSPPPSPLPSSLPHSPPPLPPPPLPSDSSEAGEEPCDGVPCAKACWDDGSVCDEQMHIIPLFLLIPTFLLIPPFLFQTLHNLPPVLLIPPFPFPLLPPSV
ncbi:unnamed protein product [Closterium sp. Naga37s-1]|nr:unnamed protein product [Closterium sp. Naga37s-1]